MARLRAVSIGSSSDIIKNIKNFFNFPLVLALSHLRSAMQNNA